MRELPGGTLFPDTMKQYDEYTIREALHNAIAHQDYTLQQRIVFVEGPSTLYYGNGGSFIPGTIENALEHKGPQFHYRNDCLCKGMVNFNMIDTVGRGIKKIYTEQRNRFFPMPDYDIDNEHRTVGVTIYGKMIDASDGGFEGVRDEGGIRATLDFVQNDLYYPTFADKLTYLMYRFCSGHFFNDGNKRIALTLSAYFLHKNNYYWHACICMRTLESIIYHVAASNIDQDLLLRIVNSFLTSKDYDEELKIDIANAMSKGELGIQGEDYE